MAKNAVVSSSPLWIPKSLLDNPDYIKVPKDFSKDFSTASTKRAKVILFSFLENTLMRRSGLNLFAKIIQSIDDNPEPTMFIVPSLGIDLIFEMFWIIPSCS